MNHALSIHLPFRHSALVWLLIGWLFVSAPVSGQDFISIRHPQSLPPRISCERTVVGVTGDYKPCLALLPGGELLLVMFASVDAGQEIREDMILYRSSDGA
ncbi:MAG: hypothetical protein FJ271_34190, partial [Planctomycetes bacterium]|nr:hypothetical protein [Planctomycetota bacterium]